IAARVYSIDMVHDVSLVPPKNQDLNTLYHNSVESGERRRFDAARDLIKSSNVIGQQITCEQIQVLQIFHSPIISEKDKKWKNLKWKHMVVKKRKKKVEERGVKQKISVSS